jgi:hypothetical protein
MFSILLFIKMAAYSPTRQLYRAYVFWGDMPLTLVFPSLLLLASASEQPFAFVLRVLTGISAMGIVMTIQSGLPGEGYRSKWTSP